MSEQDAQFSIRMPAELFHQLQQAAAEDERTVTAEVRHAIRQFLEERKGHE